MYLMVERTVRLISISSVQFDDIGPGRILSSFDEKQRRLRSFLKTLPYGTSDPRAANRYLAVDSIACVFHLPSLPFTSHRILSHPT